MEFVTNISAKEFDQFAKSHALKSHFMQSASWGQVCKKGKNLIPHYVGLKDNNQLVAATLLLQKKLFLGYSYFYAPRGYIIDFNNSSLLTHFTKCLKSYAKKNKSIFIKIDPDIELHHIDDNGLPIDDGYNNYSLIKLLKQLGYKHLGFNKGFEHNQPRYTFRLNMDKPFEEIKANFHPTTRKILNKNNPYNLEIKYGTGKDIKNFWKLMKITANRNDFVSNVYQYYYNFYNILHKHNMSDLYYITIDIKKIIKTTNIMITETKKEIKNTNNINIKNDLINKLEKLQSNLKSFKNYQQEYENNLLISAIITAKFNDKVWTIHGGNHNAFKELNANYILYYQVLLDAYNNGYKIFDFFGTTGNPNSNDNIAGIHLFKKRFGGRYIEFIGEFDLIIYKLPYFIFTKIIPMYRKIKKAIAKYRLKK